MKSVSHLPQHHLKLPSQIASPDDNCDCMQISDVEQVSRLLGAWSRVCMTTALRKAEAWERKFGKQLNLSLGGGSYLLTLEEEKLLQGSRVLITVE